MVYHRDRLGRIIQKDSHWADHTHSKQGWATRCPRGLIHAVLFYFFRLPESLF
ncbi:hypothetical protein [Wielerella bovis]|uniref:hypothetical protein n=1 Tax=Wielerella bovis TaxID=2917790 RepID=UPI002018A12E|nr:hypothetical protein [Wielerella bovis]ULJ59372.1 hypothetical protein MIS44_06580 [Wielerella bovis]